MIDLEKCKDCTAICGLTERGMNSGQINFIAQAANFGAEVYCKGEPERTEGGWVPCKAPDYVEGALLGAAAMHMMVSPNKAGRQFSYCIMEEI